MKDVKDVIAKAVMKIGGVKKKYETKENAELFLKKCEKRNQKPYVQKNGLIPNAKKICVGGMDCYVYEGQSQKIVVYLHGGAFVVRPIQAHWIFIRNINKETSATVIMPIYPLAPQNKFKTTYSKLMFLYKQILKKHKPENIIIAGDSAGATITLGMALLIKNKNLAIPNMFISISPCLDMNFDNSKILAKEKNDLMLSAVGCKLVCSSWTEGNLNEPLVSPMFGDFSGLNNIHLFSGTYDILNADVNKFCKILQNQKVGFKKYISQKSLHCYPFFPTNEGKKARQIIYDLIKNKNN